MVCSSLSIAYSTPSSFPSSYANNSTLTSSSPTTFNSFKRNPRFFKPIRRIGVRAKPSVEDDGSVVEPFMQNNSPAEFMRYRSVGLGGGQGQGGELQTSVVTYRKKFPWSLLRPFLQVDLVSAVHIADREYFATLQKELEHYDCVLYEMVARKDALNDRQSPSGMKKLKALPKRRYDIIGCIQRQMARVLTLDFQLDCLDYQTEGWYHADLDYETFELLQLQKGESMFSFAREMTRRSTEAKFEEAMSEADIKAKELGPWRSKLLWASRFLPMPLVGLLLIETVCYNDGSQASNHLISEALSRLDFSSALKILLAEIMASELVAVTSDLDDKSVVVGERNKVAIQTLQRAIDEGHNKIAILYGGGHMPDLGRRLREEFNFTPTRVQWITAWSIKTRNLNSSSLPFFKTMAEVSGWPFDHYQTLTLLILSSVLVLDLWVWQLFFSSALSLVSNTSSAIFHHFNGLYGFVESHV
ncbi:uncharacterized protein LOC131302345 [Rhododendron vialii]|uniref:uncharacterized protein LOC131302345 n=1 Tax=Rhododendron vialii TaxID=182163 RepID=UPI00265D6392|nr:uncharacterized protein LOC131302345 [Rhododendron vialii]